MINNPDEVALAEVIGFVLILALITVALSLYLVYGVPAQGRENEIIHMGVVKDQFIEYKIGLDSLFTNNLVGTTTSNTFSLGSGGGYTQGSNSIFPILSPVSSGGIFMINRRTTFPETLNITSNSYITGPGSFSADLPAQVNYTPNHVYVNISGIALTDLSSTNNFGVRVNTTKWIATVNLTPQTTFYQNYTKVAYAPGCPTSSDGPVLDLGVTMGCLVPVNRLNYGGTDLTISISKGSIVTMENFPVFKNVKPGTTYTVDLMDSSYGLNPVTSPGDIINIDKTPSKPLGIINGTGNISYEFAETNYTKTIPLGAIEYRADNNYWIPQAYYYQMGGVFLIQSDGDTTYNLPPEISFSYDYLSKISTVNISALAIYSPTGGSIVGGNSPVQIKTSLMSKNALPYAVGTANSRWIRIGVDTSDDKARSMWKNYFNYTARAAGLPNTFTGNTTTESYIDIYGSDMSSTGNFDINVIASDATYSATVFGVGGGLEPTGTVTPTPTSTVTPTPTPVSPYSYYRDITVTNSPAIANYQMKVTVPYSANMKTDFGDIRFIGSDGTTAYDYWMESKTDGSSAVFWVKVPVASTGTFRMYYGNSSLTTTSDGTNTFDFFDDFSGTLSKWTVEKPVGIYPRIESGYLAAGGGITSGAYGHTSLGSSPTYNGFKDGIIEFKHQHAPDGIGEVAFRGNFAGNTGYKGRWDARAGSEQLFLKPPYSGWVNIGGTVPKWIVAGPWYKGKLVVYGNVMDLYDDDSFKGTVTDTQYTSAGEIALQNHYGSYTNFDDVRVRKYSATEPTTSIGSEITV